MSPDDHLLLWTSVAGLWALWKLSTAPGFRFSPALLFYTIFFAMQVVGFLALVREDDPQDCLARTGIMLGVLGFVAGVGAVSVWSRFHPAAELEGVRSRFQFDEPYLPHKVATMLIGYLMASALLVYFYRVSGGIPLLDGIRTLAQGDKILTAQLLLSERRMEQTYFEASTYRGVGYFDQLRMSILPYFVASFLVWGTVTRRRKWRLAAYAAAIPALLFLLGTDQRHPTAAFMLSMAIIGYLVTSRKQQKKMLWCFGLLGLTVFAVMSLLLGRYTHTGNLQSDLPMVFLGIANRIFFSNSLGTISLFHIFPNPEPFRWGWTWLSDLQGFLPGPHVGFSAWLYRRLYGQVGTAAPMCFGEMYANFGLVGVFLGACVLGLILQGMHVAWCRRQVFQVEHLVLYAMLSMTFARWAMGGLLGPIQYGLVALPLLYATVKITHHLVVVLSCFERGIRRSSDEQGTARAGTYALGS